MADEKKPAQPQAVVMESEAQRASRALSEAADEAARVKADTLEVDENLKVDGRPMTSGGRYKVDGVLVDANGKAIEGAPARRARD